MNSIRDLVSVFRQAGDQAMIRQKAYDFSQREMKIDGSVVTETDRETEEFLCEAISERFPNVNFVTEEFARKFDPSRRWTFVIDPIDGTDNFTQGAHAWCVSLGLLDERMQPRAGIIYAPRLDLFQFADIDGGLEINGFQAPDFPRVEELNALSGLVVSSRIHNFLDLRTFPGKLRSLGSAALHLSFPACYPGLVGAIQDTLTYAWDIAGAHAILKAQGYRLSYLDGSPIDYGAMRLNHWRVENILLAARPGAWELLPSCLRSQV
jgi:fructose-1,6-bisphosphatase/inositol monophosphatase family enzyme